MLADLQPAWIITRREVRDQLRDWRIVVPIILLTVFFPGLMNFTAAQAISFVQRYGADIVGERLIPFLLMVVGFFPISISLVIALESFVGEKERRSIEPLLSTPLSDRQLYLGKLLASMVPPLIASYLGIAVYLVGVNRQIGYTPELTLVVQIFLLTAVQAVVMVSGAVVISTQTTSTRAANLLASFIIIPVALLIQVESIIMFWGQYAALWWIIIGLLIVSALLMRMGISHFNREELLGKELDTLNLGWMVGTLKDGFSRVSPGPVNGPVPFFRRFLGGFGKPILFTAGALTGGFFVGIYLAGQFQLPDVELSPQNFGGGFLEGLEALPLYSVDGVFTILFHNLRAIILATLFGIVSFGVLGILILMLPMTIIGYFTASLGGVILSPALFFAAFVLPHGILEIPAIMIAGAAILRMGAALASRAHSQSIGTSFLYALADWARVMLFVVLPLLVGAAVLEVYVTPAVALWALGR